MAFTVFRRVAAGEPPSARGIQQSGLESTFSGVRSLSEDGGRRAPQACAASNRAVWRGRSIMAFTVFRGVAAGEPPKRARHPTERSGEGVLVALQSSERWPASPQAHAASNRAAWRARLVAFKVFRRMAAGEPPKRARHPTERAVWPPSARHPTKRSGEGV